MTKTDVRRGNDWLIDDEVCRLRESGTNRSFELREALTLGTEADVRLSDSLASKQHAQVFRENGHWALRDLRSKNGSRMDGTTRPKFPLVPGLEIGIGSLTFVAESPRSIALRAFLQRLLGWSDAQIAIVDRALQAVRQAASSRRSALAIQGTGELVPIAQTIHRAVHADAPFIESNPKRHASEASVRAPRNIPDIEAAFIAAATGTLCIWSEHRPKKLATMVEQQRRPGSPVLLVICSHKNFDEVLWHPISIPALSKRGNDEVDRVIVEYGADASELLRPELEAVGAPATSLHDDDHLWIREHCASSFADIEKAVERLIALRAFRGTVAAAARVLGMSNVALSGWRANRRLPKYPQD